MTTVKTRMRNTEERADMIRFHPVGSLTQTNVQKAIEQGHAQPPAIGANATAVNNSGPYTVLATDTLIVVNNIGGGGTTINLCPHSIRNGVPLTIKDVAGNGSTSNITIVPNGVETIETLASWALKADYGAVRLVPVLGTWMVDA